MTSGYPKFKNDLGVRETKFGPRQFELPSFASEA
jgi:hypothetical protein